MPSYKRMMEMGRIYRVFVLLVLLWASTGVVVAADRGDWSARLEEGNALYERGAFDSAAVVYSGLLADSARSGVLYYNLGNAYYRQRMYPEAILSYERALKYEPGMEDAAFNLELARGFTQDRLDQAETFPLLDALVGVPSLLSPLAWGVWSLLFLALVFLVVLVVRFGGEEVRRRYLALGGAVLVLLFLFSTWMGVLAQERIRDSGAAVVMQPVVSIKSSPDGEGKDLFLLHAGAKVEIVQRVGEYYEVEIPDGRRGWVSRAAVEDI